jgi:hypothetical protein
MGIAWLTANIAFNKDQIREQTIALHMKIEKYERELAKLEQGRQWRIGELILENIPFTPQTHVWELPLSTFIRNRLIRSGLKTVGQVLEAFEDDKIYPTLGHKSIGVVSDLFDKTVWRIALESTP